MPRPSARARKPNADLGAQFIEALAEDFREHGRGTIEKLRLKSPADYLKAIAAYLPAETKDDADVFSATYSDAELIAVFEKLKPKRRAKGAARAARRD